MRGLCVFGILGWREFKVNSDLGKTIKKFVFFHENLTLKNSRLNEKVKN